MEELVAQIIRSGGIAAVLVWLLVRFVKPGLKEKGASDFLVNMVALVSGMIIAIGLTFILDDLNSWQEFVLALFIGLAAAGVATFGHEAVKNFSQRNVTNITGDTVVDIDTVSGEAVSIGRDSSAENE